MLAWLLILYLQASTALAYGLTIAFRAPLTKSEVEDVRLGLCEATTRLAGANASDTSCKFVFLSGTIYNFTAVGSDGLSGLNLTQLMTDDTLAILLRQANDGTPIRESDCNILPTPVPAVDVPGQFWEAQKALLVICGLVMCCCLVMCVMCGIVDRARGRKADAQIKHEASDLELPPLHHAKRKSGSSSSGATLIGTAASSSRSQRPPVESTTSSPRGSFEDGVPPPPLLPTKARGSDPMPTVPPRNNSLSSLDSDDGDGRHGTLGHPAELRFTPMVALPEERPAREKPKERHTKADRKGYSTRVPETDSDEEPPPPPESSPASPATLTSSPTSPNPSSASSSRSRPFTVTVVPPSPHEVKSFSQYHDHKAPTPQPSYKFEPLLSPSPSPSVRKPTSPTPAPSPTATSSTLPNQSAAFRRPASPGRKGSTTEPPQKLPLSRGPSDTAIPPPEPPSPETSPRYSTRSGRPRLSRYSVEGSKAPNAPSAPADTAHPPAFSQGSAELKFAAPARPRKVFTTDDEDRNADGEVPSLSGNSAKFHSNYKGNPLWDSYTASSDTRDRKFSQG